MTLQQSLTEQNRAIVEAMYAAVMAGDVDGLFAHFSDDIVVSEPPFLPYGKVCHGKEEFLHLFPIVGKYLDVAHVKVHHVIADGERVVGCIGIPDRASGVLTHMLEQFTLRDGKVTEIQLFYYDAGTMTELPKEV
ncbi:nuclear transport factor 2 family protein [Mycobacterium sp.]|uniref:nuclear transport factor 2 family protein n=1 Tax=Mycobacterium sp. TaxID=1785 RepID=UPI002BC79F55|nr:nuclear transport factor 2 family protein [Mycobacterium sp.]HKP44061.1 nuclear transport factor 2 family protein [Mycobacterium sp.]